MCKWGDVVEVVRPNDGRTIKIDRCVEPNLRALWDAGVATYGCCCGHGKEQTPNPCMVVADDPQMLAKADSVLPSDWEILRIGEIPLRQYTRGDRHGS